MDIFETIFLGVIQGLTEFLPVSSSGHLVVFQNILGFHEPALLLDCSLHLGTLLAVIIFFRMDIIQIAKDTLQLEFKQPDGNLAIWVIVASIPTVIIGLKFKTPLENLFGSVTITGWMLIITGIIIASTKFINYSSPRVRIGLLTALAIGIFQGLAIIPGISRSGSTIVCGLLCGLKREQAARFSFLLSIPAIMGALLLQFDLGSIQKIGIIPLLAGFFTSALVGLIALKFLMTIVKQGHLYYFAPYCWVIGLSIIILS